MVPSRFIVIYDDNFDWKNFFKIPSNFQQLIKKSIEKRLMLDPLKYGEPLTGTWKGKRKLRVSIYRVIYEVHEETVIVKIISIGLRKNVYNKFR